MSDIGHIQETENKIDHHDSPSTESLVDGQNTNLQPESRQSGSMRDTGEVEHHVDSILIRHQEDSIGQGPEEIEEETKVEQEK